MSAPILTLRAPIWAAIRASYGGNIVLVVWVRASPDGDARMLNMLLLAALTAPAFTADHRAVISEAVGKLLADPYSAQYEWPEVRNPTLYCGWVNAKNRLGAYTGYQQFMVMYSIGKKSGDMLLVGKPELDPQFTRPMCLKYGYSIAR